MHPGWSPDGRELTFLSVRDNTVGAWTVPAAGGPGRWLLPDFGDGVGSFRWSPVDRRLAYLRDRQLWVAAEGGRGRSIPLTTPVRPAALSWTPDGMHLLFSSDSERPGIYAVAANGESAPRQLLDTSGRRGALGFYGTPTDGKFVYFTWDEDLGDLWVMSADGSR